MKVSRAWLQTYFDTPLPSMEALSDALTFHAFEIDSAEGDILDVKVTPNRGHDCLSHRGIAHELSAILKLPLAHHVQSTPPVLAPTTDTLTVTIENSTLCKRYIACSIRGVKVGPSPEWLAKSLEALGQRSINNVVDATNYVMFGLGQPLHAFDAGKLEQKSGVHAVAVRLAKKGETMLALDEKEYALPETALVITDANKGSVVGIAGIKGGMPAGISANTKDIIIESANFDGVSVRRTSQALKLRTDASARFEQVLSPELAAYGMHEVVELIQKIAGGEVVGFTDVYPTRQSPTLASVTVENVNQILGTTLTGADVAGVFQRLQFPYKEEAGVFEVHIPFERLDLTISEDLVEEVGRIVGYDKVTGVELPPFPKTPEVNHDFALSEYVREQFVTQGYSEVFTSVFADRGERVVLNKVDGVRPYLRATLLDGLTDALKKNIPNKDLLGLKEIKLFEIGTVWKGGKEVVVVGNVSEKTKAEEKTLESYAGGVDTSHYQTLPVTGVLRYKTFSKYPYIVRDVSLWLPVGNSTEQYRKIIQNIFNSAGDILSEISLEDIKYFEKDYFEKGDKKSVSYRLIFQSFERTLTEVEVNKVMEKISDTLKAQGLEIR